MKPNPTRKVFFHSARLMALWTGLPEAGRKLLVTTAESLSGQLPLKAVTAEKLCA
jgi:hypothetical protein